MFDLDKLTDSINSGTIEMPSGLTHEERQVYIRDKLKELGYEVQPLGRKYDPEACMRAVQSYLATMPPFVPARHVTIKEAPDA